nr:hypothetical protein [Mycoplana azooxidifex]
MLGALTIVVVTAGGCTSSTPASVSGLRRVVGTDLVGAKGLTDADQRKIDRTVVGLCGSDIWTKDECAAHGAGR